MSVALRWVGRGYYENETKQAIVHQKFPWDYLATMCSKDEIPVMSEDSTNTYDR